MQKRAWILFLILLCVAFLISCGKNATDEREHAELVRLEKTLTTY